MKLHLLFALTLAAGSAQAMKQHQEPTSIIPGDTPLHTAARAQDFVRCFELLTQIIPQQISPEQEAARKQQLDTAIETIRTHKPHTKEYTNACVALSELYTNPKKIRFNEHCERVKQLCTALNAQNQTPYECAQNAGAPWESRKLIYPAYVNDIVYKTLQFKLENEAKALNLLK